MKLFSKLFFITILIFSFSVVFANSNHHKKADKWHREYTIRYNKITHKLSIIPKPVFPISTGIDDPANCLTLYRGFKDDLTSWWAFNQCSNASVRFWIGWNGGQNKDLGYCFMPFGLMDTHFSIYSYNPTSAEQWFC